MRRDQNESIAYALAAGLVEFDSSYSCDRALEKRRARLRRERRERSLLRSY